MQSNALRDYPKLWIVCIFIRKANTRKPIELESEIGAMLPRNPLCNHG